MLEQTVNEMQEDLIKMRQAAAQVGTASTAARFLLHQTRCAAC